MNRRLKRICFNQAFLYKQGLDENILQQLITQLPKGFKIINFGNDFQYGHSFFTVEHDTYPEVHETQVIPEQIINFTTQSKITCSHNWVKFQDYYENYTYCQICGEKK